MVSLSSAESMLNSIQGKLASTSTLEIPVQKRSSLQGFQQPVVPSPSNDSKAMNSTALSPRTGTAAPAVPAVTTVTKPKDFLAEATEAKPRNTNNSNAVRRKSSRRRSTRPPKKAGVGEVIAMLITPKYRVHLQCAAAQVKTNLARNAKEERIASSAARKAARASRAEKATTAEKAVMEAAAAARKKKHASKHHKHRGNHHGNGNNKRKHATRKHSKNRHAHKKKKRAQVDA